MAPVGAFGAYSGFFALAMIAALVARVDPWLVVKRSFIALPFAAAAITLVFTAPGPTLITLPLINVPISTPGVVRFVSIMFKSTISVQVSVILILATHLTDMLWALGALRVPRVLVGIVNFMVRYMFLLAEESVRLTRARDSRSAVLGVGPGIFFRARTTGRMIGNLFLRSFERSERIYQAMISRGYQGQMRQFDPPHIRPQDMTFVTGFLLVSLAILIIALIR
jgi:cobalt/nickel transport system permease protein